MSWLHDCGDGRCLISRVWRNPLEENVQGCECLGLGRNAACGTARVMALRLSVGSIASAPRSTGIAPRPHVPRRSRYTAATLEPVNGSNAGSSLDQQT